MGPHARATPGSYRPVVPTDLTPVARLRSRRGTEASQVEHGDSRRSTPGSRGRACPAGSRHRAGASGSAFCAPGAAPTSISATRRAAQPRSPVSCCFSARERFRCARGAARIRARSARRSEPLVARGRVARSRREARSASSARPRAPSSIAGRTTTRLAAVAVSRSLLGARAASPALLRPSRPPQFEPDPARELAPFVVGVARVGTRVVEIRGAACVWIPRSERPRAARRSRAGPRHAARRRPAGQLRAAGCPIAKHRSRRHDIDNAAMGKSPL